MSEKDTVVINKATGCGCFTAIAILISVIIICWTAKFCFIYYVDHQNQTKIEKTQNDQQNAAPSIPHL